jgi:hypothetical protein
MECVAKYASNPATAIARVKEFCLRASLATLRLSSMTAFTTSFKKVGQMHLNTQVRNIRNALSLGYNISRLSWSPKLQQEINSILK